MECVVCYANVMSLMYASPTTGSIVHLSVPLDLDYPDSETEDVEIEDVGICMGSSIAGDSKLYTSNIRYERKPRTTSHRTRQYLTRP